MKTTNEILEKSRIKSARTLSRWSKRGIIPPPLKVDTHPSGRGKIAYWDDEVLTKVLRIMKHRRQGHSLRRSIELAAHDQFDELGMKIEQVGAITEAFAKRSISRKNGTKISFLDILRGQVLAELRRLGVDRDAQAGIMRAMNKEVHTSIMLILLTAGHAPVMVWDGSTLLTTADFAVSHLLNKNAADGKVIIVIPLFKPLRQIFKALKTEFPKAPTIRPRPQILKDQGEDVIRYNIAVGEEIFKVYWDFPKVIGRVRSRTRKIK